MIDLSPYQGLIFDMDGTLIDSMPKHVEAWRQTAQKFHFSFNPQLIYQMGGMTSEEILDVINKETQLNLDSKIIVPHKRQLFESMMDSIQSIPHTVAIIKKYHGIKKIAVGTGSPKKSALYTLNRLNLLPYIDVIVTCDDVICHKPAPDTFLTAAKKLDLAPHDGIIFEDTPTGLKAAQAAKMDAILVTKNHLEFKPYFPK